jgi:malonyl CoA-acyl carrier protein transacylase
VSLAVLFPGQGSQTADMGELARRVRPDLVELATELLGADPFEHVEEGTRFLQPAIYCASMAGWELLGAAPDYGAGHSLGEVTALAAAGAIGAEDGVRLVVQRGTLAQQVVDESEDPGGMLAVLGMSSDELQPVARELGLAVANDNGPTQVVLAGPGSAVTAGRTELIGRGVRALRLDVPGPFHSPAMEPVVPRLRRVLDGIDVRRPRFPVLACATAQPFEDVREQLAQALARPVRWLDVMRSLDDRGVTRYAETGPGDLLSKLVKRALRGAEIAPVPSLDSVGGRGGDG